MNKLIRILLGLAWSGVAIAQSGALPTSLTTPTTATVNRLFYDGSSNLQYSCTARQNQPVPTTVQRSDSSLTSIVVSSNVATVTTASAHGLYPRAFVTVSGATVVPALNGSYKVTASAASTTYTFTTSGVADGTYTEATLKISTQYPLETSAVWAIQVLNTTATLLDVTLWANSNTSYNLKCSNRATY